MTGDKDFVTLETVQGMIQKAILEERKRVADKIYNARECDNGSYYTPQFSFSSSMSTLAQDILKDD
jgi:hypothetical protein